MKRKLVTLLLVIVLGTIISCIVNVKKATDGSYELYIQNYNK